MMSFILVIIKLFLPGLTAEALKANWKSAFLKRVVQFCPKFQVEGDVPHHHSSCRKTRIIDLSYGIKCSQNFLLYCHNLHVCYTDGQTDRL